MCCMRGGLPWSSLGSATCRRSRKKRKAWAAAASPQRYEQRSVKALLLCLDQKGILVFLIMLRECLLDDARNTRCEGAKNAGVKCLRSPLKTGKPCVDLL